MLNKKRFRVLAVAAVIVLCFASEGFSQERSNSNRPWWDFFSNRTQTTESFEPVSIRRVKERSNKPAHDQYFDKYPDAKVRLKAKRDAADAVRAQKKAAMAEKKAARAALEAEKEVRRAQLKAQARQGRLDK